MSKFDISSLLNEQSTPPVGPQVRVTMIDRSKIQRNPENSIYIIGDVSTLAEDIKANGIRQPLEVVPVEDGYMLIGGHRRLAACDWLLEHGKAVIETVPCIVRQSKGAAEDVLDLITANATARELTDGERLDQYVALKKALEQLKREGKLQGRVADEAARRLGESGGGVRRLNAIANNCIDEVKQMLREDKCGITRAYEASQLPSRKQLAYAETGKVPPTPGLTDEQRNEVKRWLLHDSPAVPYLQGLDWEKTAEWNFMDESEPGRKDINLCYILGLSDGLNAIIGDRGRYVTVSIPDPADEKQELYSGSISWRDLYLRAKAKYQTAEARAAAKEAREKEEAGRKQRQEVRKEANTALNDVTSWPVNRPIEANLVVYSLPLADGWVLQALSEPGGVGYVWPKYRMFDGNGEPVPQYSHTGWYNQIDEQYYPAIVEAYRALSGGERNA